MQAETTRPTAFWTNSEAPILGVEVVMEFLEDANDPKLKPRLLRTLVVDRLPDEKRPLPSPSQIWSIVSLVRVHDLLSESLPQRALAGQAPIPDKLARAWGGAVDAWVERCLALASNKMPYKRWVGISLLGITFETCAPERFLRSYSDWFEALLSNIQPSEDSHFIKLASCASMSDLFTRLSRFANIKKDATSLASKLSQTVVQLLNVDDTDDSLVGALDLLMCLLNLFPFSMHRHCEKVEAVIVSKIMSEKFNAAISKKFAHCLASLAKVKGDEDSWNTMMLKLLVSVSFYLTKVFQGLEEESSSRETMRLLIPPGKEPPPSLGDLSFSAAALEQSTNRMQEVPMSFVYTLMQCCCIMVTSPYPAPVNLPIHPLFLLVERVLSVDGSLHETRTSFTSELHQELICSELPSLHMNCLDLLIAVIKALRSQLLPHVDTVIRILTDYMKGVTLPCLRIKVYSVMQILLTSTGVGMAMYLADNIIKNSFADLNMFHSKSNSGSVNLDNSKATQGSIVHPSSRKRKHVSSSLKEQVGADIGKEGVNRKSAASLSVQIAALGALESLITMAGSHRAEHWRQDVDQLLMAVAAEACSYGWATEKRNHVVGYESSPSPADFQLAALRALLVSLLSHAYVRPRHLAQAFDLFRRGKQEVGTKVASFCTHAMLTLEVLIHPRSLSLMDFPAVTNSGFDELHNHATFMLPSNPTSNLLPFTKSSDRGVKSFGLLDDDLHDYWSDNEEETGVPLTRTDKLPDDVDTAVKEVEDSCPEGIANIGQAHGCAVTDGSTDPKCASGIGITSYGQDDMVEPRKTGELNSHNVKAGTDDTPPSHEVASGFGDVKGTLLVTGESRVEENIDTRKDFDIQVAIAPEKMTSDSPSLDSLPDIVDADPDSD